MLEKLLIIFLVLGAIESIDNSAVSVFDLFFDLVVGLIFLFFRIHGRCHVGQMARDYLISIGCQSILWIANGHGKAVGR